MLFDTIRSQTEGIRAIDRFQLLVMYDLLKGVVELPGDAVELGVFRGGSARMIASMLPEKMIHLYDTFEGMPDVRGDYDDGMYHGPGTFNCSLEDVQEYLKDLTNIEYHVGIFPDRGYPSFPICFAHCDADLYQPTADFLMLVYPLLVPGGVLVVHDYKYIPTPGVTIACDEFFADKPEKLIVEAQCQAYVRKI